MEPCNCSALQHGAASVRNCMLADSDWAVTRFGDKATNMTGATVGAALACAAALLCLFWCAYASYRERRAQRQHSPQAWMHATQAAQAARADQELDVNAQAPDVNAQALDVWVAARLTPKR